MPNHRAQLPNPTAVKPLWHISAMATHTPLDPIIHLRNPRVHPRFILTTIAPNPGYNSNLNVVFAARVVSGDDERPSR
eukprot:CAMPEP_0171415334 /NCGR_PEP_ID=MMETSP0880-20121228/39507_1 /TAXON_ID=67004 /ORGANISM="Thalassiosira weissflogii, Strain CCMP1336" /LENGTH=77 /DNA_ID=CAMNT_0011933545 /DNA_START=166 /DNA_END=395 /DNA_ORIENTATION=+